jgi:hypothetical protein
VRCVVSIFVLVCSFASYGLVSVYDQRCLRIFFGACLRMCCVEQGGYEDFLFGLQ